MKMKSAPDEDKTDALRRVELAAAQEVTRTVEEIKRLQSEAELSLAKAVFKRISEIASQ